MEIKNLDKVAKRILKAIKNEEKIILYGDADLDGVSSVILLKESIENLNGKISAIYFPDREVEGYGISKKSLEILKEFSPALFIVLDCGISNFEEIELAKKLGFEVIIIDHHEILDNLPKAEIIVDPKQPGDDYPFKELATVGIVFKLSQILLKDKMTEILKRNFLELVALATLADMMPQVKENKTLIEEGLISLENSWRPGIMVFLKEDSLQRYNISKKVSKIISFLNVRNIENGLQLLSAF
jgi:single-stranded-DNA-specific exonuclease